MAAPTVTSATPATGAYSGGTPVLMVGAGFTGATVVAFGASTTTGFTVYSDTLLIVAAPAHAAGAVAVSVTTAGGTGSGGTFTYTGAPALFTVAQARAFDKGQLANGATFPDAVIAAEEAAIRAKFERIIGIALSPTVGTEYHDADGRRLQPATARQRVPDDRERMR